ncbi:response regulator transcription factor [Mollicutes bacterium LVI A0039]|nr:response regulator transcription factor [Mollicutes bacterium LVI A0039]
MKKILLVDDDSIYLDTLEKMLSAQYQVTSTVSARDAIKLLGNDTFDLVVTDLYMDEMTGLQLFDIIDSLFEGQPVLFVSGQASAEDQISALNSKALDIIDKSNKPEVVLTRINRTINNISSGNIEVSYQENIKLNLDTHTCQHNDIRVHLSNKEFKLLAYLLKNRNRILTRNEIYTNVWGIELRSTNLRIVDIHILKLRKKFNLTSINSERGVGYKWEE